MPISSTHRKAFLAMLALGLWLIKSPYYGLWHDSRFYALIALQRLHPALYHNDLFFLYGSQASYTMFTPWLTGWIQHFGLDNGLLYATIIGQIASIAAITYLARALLPRSWVIGLLVISLFPTHYTEVFAFSESFVTPRLYSEALSLFGLGALLRNRYWLAGIGLLSACAVHPLMGLPAVAIALLLMIRQPRYWLWLTATASAVLLIAVVFKLGPLAHMDHLLTPQLVAFESLRSPWLFIHLWPWTSISIMLYSLLILALASLWLDGVNLRLVRAALLMALFGLLMAGMADISKQTFLLALQPARALWLVQVLSELLWLPVATHLWRTGQSGRMAVVLLGTAALGVHEAMTPIAVLSIIYWWGYSRYAVLQARSIQLLLWLIPAQALLFAGLTAWLQWEARHLFIQLPIAQVLMTTLLPPAIALFAGLWLWQVRYRPALNRVLMLTALICLPLSLALWDVRPDVNPADSVTRERVIAPLRRHIPIDAVVYWEGNLIDPWFWLQRAQYISLAQMAGTIFDERTAIEGMRRMNRMRFAGFPDANWDDSKINEYTSHIHLHSLPAAAYICADPILHTLILRYPVAGLASEYAFVDPNTGDQYYVYPCSAILATVRTLPINKPVNGGIPHA